MASHVTSSNAKMSESQAMMACPLTSRSQTTNATAAPPSPAQRRLARASAVRALRVLSVRPFGFGTFCRARSARPPGLAARSGRERRARRNRGAADEEHERDQLQSTQLFQRRLSGSTDRSGPPASFIVILTVTAFHPSTRVRLTFLDFVGNLDLFGISSSQSVSRLFFRDLRPRCGRPQRCFADSSIRSVVRKVEWNRVEWESDEKIDEDKLGHNGAQRQGPRGSGGAVAVRGRPLQKQDGSHRRRDRRSLRSR